MPCLYLTDWFITIFFLNLSVLLNARFNFDFNYCCGHRFQSMCWQKCFKKNPRMLHRCLNYIIILDLSDRAFKVIETLTFYQGLVTSLAWIALYDQWWNLSWGIHYAGTQKYFKYRIIVIKTYYIIFIVVLFLSFYSFISIKWHIFHL